MSRKLTDEEREDRRLRRQAQDKAKYAANREATLARVAAYKAANPDKVAACSHRYTEENRELLQAKDRTRYHTSDARREASLLRAANWGRDHPEQILQHKKKWAQANPEKVKLGARQYYAAHAETCSLRGKDWRSRNRGRVLAYAQNRRALQSDKLSPGLHAMLLAEQNHKCCYCFQDLAETGQHLDHWYPLGIGGPNTDDNIVVSCPTCNRKKSARSPLAFVAEMNATWLI